MSENLTLAGSASGTTQDLIHHHVLGRHSQEMHDLRQILGKRSERYTLRWFAKNRFMEEGRKQGLQYPHDFHRTAKCGSVLIAPSVGVNYSLEHNRAFFTGILMCGMVWPCPVCSAKIQESRREEISLAMDWAPSKGLKCIMVTFTVPHNMADILRDLLLKESEAFKLMRTGKTWQNQKQKFGFIGLIRSLEITIGKNGWHPHTHELWFVDESCNAEDLHRVVLQRWEDACLKTGLLTPDKIEDFRKHAVNFKDNCTNSDYLQKIDKSKSWGVDREIAKTSSKSSRSGCHPFELLCECVGNLPTSKDKRSEMFLEYVEATKGKRQLFWSHGLKKLVGIVDKTDQEICEESEKLRILLGNLDPKRWKIVTKEIGEPEILFLVETTLEWKNIEEWFKERE